LRYPPDPPTVEEIIAVKRAAGDRPDGLRLRGVIVVLWRAGLRISELDRTCGAVLVRRGKGGKRGEVGMDRWAWEQLERVAHHPSHAPCRCCVLRASRPNTRPAVLARRDPGAVAQYRSRSRGPSPIRAGSICRHLRYAEIADKALLGASTGSARTGRHNRGSGGPPQTLSEQGNAARQRQSLTGLARLAVAPSSRRTRKTTISPVGAVMPILRR
jgi:hypothetical protein